MSIGNLKGAGVYFLRQLYKNQDPKLLSAFLSKLSPEDQRYFNATLPGSWLPIENAVRIYTQAAETLYPGNLTGLEQIGQGMAQDNLTGILRFLLRLATIPFVIEQAARFWKTYHERGAARVVKQPNTKENLFIIEEFPDMPAPIRRMNTGYIKGTLELIGAKNPRVYLDEGNPAAWTWKVLWD